MKKSIYLIFLMSAVGLFGQKAPISGGYNYSAAVCENQSIYVWGTNSGGQLGIDDFGARRTETFINTPVLVSKGNISLTTSSAIGILPPFKKIDAGAGAHILALSCRDQLWAWGNNFEGELGRGMKGDSPSPLSYIPSRVLKGAQDAVRDVMWEDPYGIYLNNIQTFSAGYNSSFAVESGTGYILAWGNNDFGQLGDGTIIDRTIPVYVLKEDGTRLSNIVSVEGGEMCTYALDAAGNVWSWGVTHDGGWQTLYLGRTPTPANIHVAGYGGNTRCAPRAGRVVVTTNRLNPHGNCGAAPLSNIVQISSGPTHCLALDANGNVWSFGGDWGEGQLGKGDVADYTSVCATRVVAPGVVKTTNWIETDFLGSGVDGKAIFIAAGQASSAVVLANGKVVTFGARGLYAISTVTTGNGAISCPMQGSMIVAGTLGDGHIACNGNICGSRFTNATQSLTPVYVTGIPTEEKINQVSGGNAWYFAISNTGKVYTWGWNRRGELGLGDYTDRCQATRLELPCSIEIPCSTKPDLGADVEVCPTEINIILNSNVRKHLTNEIRWYYTTTPTGTKNLVSSNTETFIAKQAGYYIVEVYDDRAYVASECGPCYIQKDTIEVKDIVIDCVITDIDDIQDPQSLIINPNPNRGSFLLSVPEYLTQAVVVVVNAMGQKVYQSQINQKETNFELSNLSSGVYNIRIIDKEGVATTRLVIE